MIEIVKQIKRHEGYRSKVYRCPAGKWTIGYGRNLQDRGISEDEADLLLINDIVHVKYRILADRKHHKIFKKLNEARQAVIINMGYNLGIAGLFEFKKMWAALEEDKFSTASAEMLDSRWANQVGRRAIELAAQMRTGRYPQEMHEV